MQSCAICGIRYHDIENLGRWQCFQHPGRIVDGRFTCCYMHVGPYRDLATFYANTPAKRRRGCVPCDHRPTTDAYAGDIGKILMPFHLFDALNPLPKAVINTDPIALKMSVSRYDYETTSRQQIVMEMHASAESGDVPMEHLLQESIAHNPELVAHHMALI